MASYLIDPKTGKQEVADPGTANPAGIKPGSSGQATPREPAPAVPLHAAAPAPTAKTPAPRTDNKQGKN